MQLFSPLRINNTELKNRTVMAPMVANSAGADGSVTESFQNFYLARARGGAGLIVLGATYVLEEGKGFGGQLGIHRDDLIPGLSGLARTLGEHARVAVQLSYKSVGRPPETFSRDGIETVRQAFVKAALRAEACAFDGVEIHACHDYWLNYFLSPFFNHRTDEYGGSLDNRFRLLGEVVREIRSAVSPGFIVGVRLSLDDFMDQGLGLADSVEIGRRLEKLGVDYLSASVGIGLTQYRMSPPSEVSRGSELTLARVLKESVSIPVIGVGRLDRPEIFKAAVEDGYVGLAAVGRALIADPEFILKIAENRETDIRPCLACNHCLTCLHRGEELCCVVNPLVGRDMLTVPPLSGSHEVLVIGGGPAGLTAAAMAARRGAAVRLVEKKGRLGGALNLAQKPPHKEPLRDFSDFLIREAEKAGVQIELNREIDLAGLADDSSQTPGGPRVIMACGARPIIPKDCGLEGDHILTAEQVLSDDAPPPGRYLVLGGGLVGLETAEFLAEAGSEVTVVEMCEALGRGLGPMKLKLILDRLIKAGANLLTCATLTRVDPPLVRVALPAGEVALGPYDGVVVAAGYQCDLGHEALFERMGRWQVIGDARKPRSILEAVGDGFDAALRLE